MTYWQQLDRLFKSRLYVQAQATFIAGFYLLLSTLILFGIFMALEISDETPTTGIAWILIPASVAFAYTLSTFLVMTAALWLRWKGRKDPSLFRVGAYLLLFLFPVGTIISLICFRHLETSENIDSRNDVNSSGSPDSIPAYPTTKAHR